MAEWIPLHSEQPTVERTLCDSERLEPLAHHVVTNCVLFIKHNRTLPLKPLLVLLSFDFITSYLQVTLFFSQYLSVV